MKQANFPRFDFPSFDFDTWNNPPIAIQEHRGRKLMNALRLKKS